MKDNVYILLGPPGSGKGTQSDILAQKLSGVHLSSGQLLRDSNDPVIVELISTGKLAKSEDFQKVIDTAITAIPVETPIILDGVARMLNEAKWLESRLRELGRGIAKVIYVQVNQAETTARNIKRGRSDDEVSVQNERWKLYTTETLPVLEYYRAKGVLAEVNGAGSIEEVAARVDGMLG